MIIHESNNLDVILAVYKALTVYGGFKVGDVPNPMNNFSKEKVISYVLVKNNEGYLDCEIRVKKDATEIITQSEFKERFDADFCADDIPF